MLPGSDNSAGYYASVESSQNSQNVEIPLSSSERPEQMDQSENAPNPQVQDPVWTFIANGDEEVMMTYQLPSR